MLRKVLVIFMCLSLCLPVVACSSSTPNQSQTNTNGNTVSNRPRLTEGTYPVQQATYNDANGEYSLMLLNTPSGYPPVFETTDLQMARLTDEEISEGKNTYLEVKNDSAVMHLTEDFKIEYVHNVTETRTDPQTGQQQTVIVRRESNFWTPFAGALAGQAIGSLLFRPQYYVPPVYSSGGIMRGYGGYGNTYDSAVERYRSNYNSSPAAVTNRQTLRTSGNLRNSSRNQATNNRTNLNNKPSGSGFGSTNLNSSGNSNRSKTNSGSRFGSGVRTPRRSFSRGRRR